MNLHSGEYLRAFGAVSHLKSSQTISCLIFHRTYSRAALLASAQIIYGYLVAAVIKVVMFNQVNTLLTTVTVLVYNM